MVAFRKCKNIQQHIVKNDINSKSQRDTTETTNQCNKTCKTCKLLSKESIIKSTTNHTFELKTKNHCNAKNIVYADKCKQHNTIYVGQTGEELRNRFNKHRYDAKNVLITMN